MQFLFKFRKNALEKHYNEWGDTKPIKLGKSSKWNNRSQWKEFFDKNSWIKHTPTSQPTGGEWKKDSEQRRETTVLLYTLYCVVDAHSSMLMPFTLPIQFTSHYKWNRLFLFCLTENSNVPAYIHWTHQFPSNWQLVALFCALKGGCAYCYYIVLYVKWHLKINLWFNCQCRSNSSVAL